MEEKKDRKKTEYYMKTNNSNKDVQRCFKKYGRKVPVKGLRNERWD